MSDIKLKLNEENEITFKLSVMGNVSGPATVRMICETDDLAFVFKGHAAEAGSVKFIVPALHQKLDEGVYSTRLEVLVDNKYFVPLQFNTTFEAEAKYVVESIQVKSNAVNEPVISATQMIKEEKEMTPLVVSQKLSQPLKQSKPLIIATEHVSSKSAVKSSRIPGLGDLNKSIKSFIK